MNENSNPEEDDESWISEHIIGVMVTLVCIAILIIIIASTAYFVNFNGTLSSDQNVWGTFGDYVGGVLNPSLSFIAFIALLLTIVLQSRELRFTRNELKLSRLAQQESKDSISTQSELMKDSATLSALSNIYNHYDINYGQLDSTGILKKVADGHRSWAIRESFSIIDVTFEQQREALVNIEFEKLLQFLRNPVNDVTYFQNVSQLIGSLIVDKRLESKKRKLVWEIYEFVRQSAHKSVITKNSDEFNKFKSLASDVINNS